MSSIRELTWRAEATGFDKVSKEVEKADKAVDKAKRSFSGFDTKLKTIGGQLSKRGKELSSLGGKITKFTAPITAVGVAGFKMANDLDRATRQVSTLTSKAVLPLSKIKKEVKSISHETGIAQKEVANSMYEALSSGINEKEVVEFTKSAYTLTEAGFTDMSTAIDSTTTVMNAYGEKAYEVAKIHDIFVKTQDEGKITVDELGHSIGNVIPIASSVGVNIDQLGASYAMMTKKGQKSEKATTGLKALLNELSKSGSKADKALKGKLNKSFAELSAEGANMGEVLSILDEEAKRSGKSLNDMFGSVEAGSAALTLLSEGTDGYNKMLKAMQESDGTAKKNAEKMMGDAKKWSMAVNDIKIAMTELGGAVAPYVAQFAGVISTLAEKFSNLDDDTKGTIAEWGLLIATVGPAIMIFGKLVSVGGIVLSGLGTAIGLIGSVIGFVAPLISLVGGTLITVLGSLSAPFLLIAGAIGTVIAIGANLIGNWKQVKSEAQALGGGIKGYLLASLKVTGQGFISMKNKAVSALDSIKQKWNAVKEFLKHPIKGTISILQKGSAKTQADGSHASGLNSVPFDNYLGNLHQGEMVLPASTAERYRRLGGDINHLPTNTSNSTNFAPVINVTVNGNATKEDANNVAQTVRDVMEKMFKYLRLQRV